MRILIPSSSVVRRLLSGVPSNLQFNNSSDSSSERITASGVKVSFPHCGLLQCSCSPLSASPATSHCWAQVGKPSQSNVHSVVFQIGTGRSMSAGCFCLHIFCTYLPFSRRPLFACLGTDARWPVMEFVGCLSWSSVFY